MNPSDLIDDDDADSTQIHPGHERLLACLSGDRDPCIPTNPLLDSYFTPDKSTLRFHSLPYLAFSREFILWLAETYQLTWPVEKEEEVYMQKKALHVLHLLVDDPLLFKWYFNQILFRLFLFLFLNRGNFKCFLIYLYYY